MEKRFILAIVLKQENHILLFESTPQRLRIAIVVMKNIRNYSARGVATCTQIRNCVPENNNKKINK